MLPSSLYSPSDWAELFTLCARYSDSAQAADYHAITEWLTEWSKTHDCPPPEDTPEWSDTRSAINESLMFLDKFAENHMDEFTNRKESQNK